MSETKTVSPLRQRMIEDMVREEVSGEYRMPDPC